MGNQKSKKIQRTEENGREQVRIDVGAANNSYTDLRVAQTTNPTNRTTPPTSSRILMRAMFTFQRQQDGDLSIKVDEILELIDNSDEFWWKMRNPVTRDTGFVPYSYVQPCDGGPTSMAAWFDVDRREAERALLMPGLQEGTFLIRPSRQRAGRTAYSLSVRIGEQTADGKQIIVRHYLVREVSDRFFITPAKTFVSMQNLVRHYQNVADGLYCRLSIPCPRKYMPPPNFRDFELNRNQLTITDKLGNGSFGEVWKARFGNLLEVAVKMMISNGERPHTSMNKQEFIREAEIMRKLHHPKIVQLLGVCTTTEPFYIVTELMPNGALLSYLRNDNKNGRTITFNNMLDMMCQIADGMAYLEEKKFIHRDLRAANILVGHYNVVKVADFGLSRLIDDEESGADIFTRFPVRWTAPEIATKRIVTTKSDVWSFGVLIYEIVTRGGTPYPDYNNRDVLNFVLRGYRLANPRNEALGIQCDDFMYQSIMMACWRENPHERPTFVTLRGLFESYDTEMQKQYA